MSKRLKSFHKLFFIVIFSILFSGVIGSSNSPELPEKIAPELEQIEALPRRTKPAELNIEVTKIKSEPLEEVYIDRENKNIYVDFSKKREQALKGVRNSEDLEKKYNLIISENIQSSGEVVGKGRTKMATNPQVMTYETAELDGKKMLKIPYENEPEKLYISVQENNQVIKVYSMDISKSTGVNGNISNNPLMINTTNWNEVIISDVENISNLIEFGRIGMEQTSQSPIYLGNPFPVIALGEKGTLNNQATSLGWSFTSWEYSIPIRTNKVISSYRNSTLNKNFTMEMSLENRVILSGYSRIERGNPVSSFGTFYPGTTEKITADLRGQLQDLNQLNNIFIEFRNKNEREYIFSPSEPLENQISFVVSQAILSGYYYYDVPAKNNLTNGDKKIENRAYPNIKLVKPLIQETLTLNIGSGFNIDNNIVFTQNGINSIPGASLTPTNTRNLKSLHFASNFKLKNNSNETAVIDVDTTGNSTSSNEFIINNGSNELKLSLQYKNRYPEIKILNAPKAGTYTLNIVHYEPSTLERLNYTLNIVLQNDLLLPEPGMVRTNVLKEFIIEDDIENETYKIINSDLGILTMQQTKTIPAGDMFPFIALGAKDGPIGWSFNSTSPSKARGTDIIVNYENDSYSQYSLKLKMFLEKNISLIGATEISVSSNNLLSGIGLFKLNENEKISALLKGTFVTSSEQNLLNLLAEFRSRSEREIVLTPREELENQISYVIGDYKNNTYTVPTNITLSSVDKKVDSIKYPNIKIRKPLLEENVTLTIPSTYDIKNPILFNENGVNNGETTSDKDRYLKSLYYDSSFNINGATLKNITNSTSSDDYNITLNNGDKQLVMKVKYENNYPKFTFLNNPSPGTYTLNIKHYDPVGNQRLSKGLERLDYTVDIVVLDSTSSTKEFDVTSSLRDIVILPDGKIESPDNWIKMVQLVSDKGKFPVIGINRPSWDIETDRPLNPIDKRPTAILDLGPTFGKIEVPVNIRETPYQNTQKFLVYDRGDMTNRNIAVGAYTSLTSTDGSGLNNKVQVDFQVFLNLLPQAEIQKILNYARAKFTEDSTKTKVEIPYSTTDMNGSTLPTGYHKIYSIRGLQKATSKIFDVNQNNILDYGILDFPKIVVLKNETFNTNTATLNFINPVPKSAGDISGTFDISLGVVAPNNLQAYNHPSSLNISGVSNLWNGFTTIPEYHKIRISSVTETKEFTTTEGGDMKGTQTVASGNNNYVFMKGKISPLAVGVLSWDFQQKTDDIIKLQHLNSSGRVVAEDVYRINLTTFNPSVYLDRTNSTMLNTINASNKSLTITANVRQDFVDLGGLKLQNYQKDITKTGTLNPTTGLYANEVRVEAYPDLLTLNLQSNPSSTIKLKGRLKFDSEKTNISAPNELGSLKFVLDSTNNLDDIAGKTFTITKPAGFPLVSIKGGGKQDEILNTLTITLQEKQSGALPNMSFVSTLTALTVEESSLTNGMLSLRMPGQMTLRQLDGGQGNSVPAIALGDYNDWKILLGSGVTRTNPRTRAQLPVTYQIGTTNITLYPELSNPIASVDGSQVGVDGQPILSSDIRLYTERDNASPSRILTALTYVRCRNTRNERITTGLTLNIAPNQLTALMEALKNIPGDKVELKATGNKARVAYIHGKDEGTSGVCGEGRPLTLPADTLSGTSGYAFETLPSIFIEKEKLYKNVEINVLPGYVLGSKITFNSVNNIIIPTGIQVIPEDNRVFEGLGYQHTVKLILPGGEIKTYITDSTGKLLITENVEKNGKTITLNIQYRSGKDVDVWVSERNGSQYFDFVLQHIDPSGDVRRTTNIRINSGVEGSTAKLGEMDFVISSRYNATETSGQLISNPLVIALTGITYQTEVLDLKLLNGDFPEAPGTAKTIEVKDSNGTNTISIPASGGDETITLINGTILKLTKTSSGDLKIKPLKWNYNATDKFVLTYKNGTVITNQYTFNIICPEFFVASVGVLDFGKIYKIGNPADKTVTTNIELEYKDGTVQATYSLDVSQSNPDGKLTNSLYLNDEKTLLVKDLHLGSELGAGNAKRTLPLTGTVDGNSVKNTNPGVYQKTIQILIHLQ
ncbi:hypothetical protein [Cetobacterium somerae]|uniref:hypothetical protein n=1 Tax=Cetobacterium somerae TaxID=188913 RepID=UPI00248E8259|nr:hypothetical protein [Cetobacterium somerae]